MTLTILTRKEDPTRTLTLRNTFIADFKRRFRELKRAITEYIVRGNQLEPTVRNLFQYRYAQEKYELFYNGIKV